MALVGAVVWGVVPFAPAAPFRLYAGTGTEPLSVTTAQVVQAGIDPEVTVLVPTKIRPMLVIADPPQAHEVLALRLHRFAKLSVAEQQTVRAQDDPSLFHLLPARFPGLREENAAIIETVTAVNRTALDSTGELGRLDRADLATVHERVASAYGLNLSRLVLQRIRDLQAAQRSREAGG